MLKANFEPVLASDGKALLLLQKEFPTLKSYTLPSYNIKYAKSQNLLLIKLFLSIPFIFFAVIKEKKLVAKLIKEESINGIISDNRFGIYNATVPSVYITHQLNVLAGFFSFITSKIHRKIIQKFDECWVCDVEQEINLSGKLGHINHKIPTLKYIGILSRMKYKKVEFKYDLLVLLSGPEPLRSLLEKKLLSELKTFKGSVLFVQGVIAKNQKFNIQNKITIVNYLLTNDINKIISQSNLVVARSGYSTIMDLAVLKKKAFFIPTPGQFEQQYLAEYLQKKQISPYSMQKDFSLEKLELIKNYSGFVKDFETNIDLNLFHLFKGKRKF